MPFQILLAHSAGHRTRIAWVLRFAQDDNSFVDGGVRDMAEAMPFRGAFSGIALHSLRTERARGGAAPLVVIRRLADKSVAPHVHGENALQGQSRGQAV